MPPRSEDLYNGMRIRRQRQLQRLNHLTSDNEGPIIDDDPPQDLVPAEPVPPAPALPDRRQRFAPPPAKPAEPVAPPAPAPPSTDPRMPPEPIRRLRQVTPSQREEVIETALDRYLIGGAMLVVAVILWAIGASHSLDGWVIVLNVFFEVAGLPWKINPIVGADRLLFIPLGIVYTVAEFRLRLPSWRAFWRSPAMALSVIAFALLIHGSDVGSTFVYAIRPGEEAWAIHRAAAANWALALGYAFFMTYIPELMARQGWKRLGRDDEQFD